MLLLRFPNAEVKDSYSKSLLRRLYGATSQNVIMAMEERLKEGETALTQIKDKRYADKFRLEKGKTIHLLGIAFSSTGHTVQDWKEEVLV